VKILTANQLREADTISIKKEAITSYALMERAAKSALHWIVTHYPLSTPFVVICGTGNNGGEEMITIGGQTLESPIHTKRINILVEITSPKFWVIPLNQNQIEKFQLIKKLKREGLTYLQISNYLNETKIYKPERTDKFTPELVFSLNKKMKQRENRLKKEFPIKILSVGFEKEEINFGGSW